MLKTSMQKTLIASALVLAVVLPVKAQQGPRFGTTDSVGPGNLAQGEGRYARVCTKDSRNGRLSLRTGPGRSNRVIKEIPNGQVIRLFSGVDGQDGFYWVNVKHGASSGWVRGDYVCE